MQVINTQRTLKLFTLTVFCGLAAGLASSVFLHSLHWATNYRLNHTEIIWYLPIAGFLIAWVYHHFGKQSDRGHNLIIDEIHEPKNIIPLRMAPLVFFGTLATHLFGGSAGREGTAVQIGGTLADQISRMFHLDSLERKKILIAGIGAGFSSAIGAPLAGVFFGIEVLHIGKIKFTAWFESLIASFVAYYFSLILQTPHSNFLKVNVEFVNLKFIIFSALAGVLFGLSARFFIFFTHLVEKILAKFISIPPWRTFLGGVILALLFSLADYQKYSGLGIEYIHSAFHNAAAVSDSFLKIFFTAVTIGSGFKGGEFIPLVFIGTTLGSTLSSVFPVSIELLSVLGFAAVFAGAANTPLACSIMAIELFGPTVSVYVVIACFVSYFVSGHQGIYKSQRLTNKKWIR